MWTVTLDTRSIVALTLAVAGAVAFVAAPSTAADAADAARRAPRSTHLSSNADDHVLLRLTDPTGTPKFVRVGSDGTEETAEFEVPEGQRLVVLDVDFTVFDITGAAVLSAFRLRLQNTTTSDVVPAYVVPTTPIGYTDSGSGSNKRFGHSTGLTAGFVVEPGTRILADIVDLDDAHKTAAGSFDTSSVLILLRGYLTSGS